jgi:hypothetical protein
VRAPACRRTAKPCYLSGVNDPLDAELDALFQQLPAAHVEARNALAQRLSKGGDRPGAERIKKIKRPAPCAWALNLLHFRDPAQLTAASAAAAALRDLHARDDVSQTDLSAAVTAQRRAVQATVTAALRCAEQAGLALNSADERKLETTLKAWLAGAGDEPPGRMTHELEASGFDGLAAVGLTSPRPPRPGEASEQPAESERVRTFEASPTKAAHAEATLRAAAAAPESRQHETAAPERVSRPRETAAPERASRPRDTAAPERASRTRDTAAPERASRTRDTAVPQLPASDAPRAPAQDPERLNRARARFHGREREAAAARQKAAALREKLSAEAAELERLRDSVREAEQALEALARQRDRHQEALVATRKQSNAADAAAREAERGVTEARAELTRLEKSE